MNRTGVLLTCMLLIGATASTAGTKSSGILHPTHLTCEYLVDPLGIDIAAPRLSWILESSQRKQRQSACQILVSSTMENLHADNGDWWDSKKLDGDRSINVRYSGKELAAGTAYVWKVRVWDQDGRVSSWSSPAKWSMGLLHDTDWSAKWIGLDRLVGSDDTASNFTRLSARMLRKEFSVSKNVRRATAYVCGLGMFELYINGRKISNDVFVPACTEYNKRALYLTFDVTGNVRHGGNALGVILGNGRYFAMRRGDMTNYGFPKLLLQLVIEYTDGTMERIVSDESWKLTTDGPIRANNEYDGEEYDARKEIPGWDIPGFDDRAWMNAEIVKRPSERLEAQMSNPMMVMDSVKPVSIKKIHPGSFIFDLGQNMVGWARVNLHGKRGDTLTMRFAERLNNDGTLYLDNLRSARVTDTYILKGDGQESWQPRFTYHGFRYIEVTGYPGTPPLSAITGEVVYDAIATTGSFATSNATINKIWKNAYWGIRGNYRSMPTDCPQRDERMGWLGDRATGSKGESFIFDNNALYAKWLTDINDAQL
ncbi:MAG TPA: family 78 glycoside hydrolase catalytic domain, partial [Bacteroidota bacterium]|nr:family 78 glycoside hydrolase catalytic domain [Bacteroidota bacterium]